MLRLRRYRTFLVFATFTIIALYRFRSTQWGPDSPFRPNHLNGQGQVVVSEPTGKARPYVANIPEAESTQEQALLPSVPPASKPTQTIARPTQPPAESPLDEVSLTAPDTKTADDGGPDQVQYAIPTTTSSVIHWSKLPEHFPVPTESVIQLPSGKPKAIPKIQHIFPDESSWSRTERGQKQAAIKKTFKKAWLGYKEHAWLHDELTPVSGGHRDPFCGWAATLVDSLDTLWIMGFDDEFKEALEALKGIDFTTAARADIPLFETTIRYLGGLLGAYDVSGGKYRILVEKAVELADVLMGAFDTPNRMPLPYYRWKPYVSLKAWI
jgi:mannosyl-oligosaccharide alpha-1,2-mannosidase